MKKIYLIISLVLAAAAAQAQGIKFFEGSYADAQKEARKQNKLIFIDCYTIWCGPCNRMARDVFPRKDVGDFFNSHFICCKLDMEKGEGLVIAKDYAVRSYPTYLFLSGSGEMAHRTLGSKEASKFIEDGQTAADPEHNLQGLATKFAHGSRDTALLKQLIMVSTEVEPELNEKALSVYWEEITEAKLTDDRYWPIFRDYEKNINSKAYQYVAKYRADFDTKYGKDEVDNVLYSKAADAIRTAADTKNATLFSQAATLAQGCPDKKINEAIGLNTLRFYRKTGDWKSYIAYADPFLKKYGTTQEIYNSVAWEMVANGDNDAVFQEALVYADKSVALDKNYGNTDTRANVLYKLKRYKDAETAAVESIALAKKEKLDYTSTQELLDKIRTEKARGQN